MSITRQRSTVWLLVAASVVLSAIGQLCMKVGMLGLAAAGVAAGSSIAIGELLVSPPVLWTVAGLAAYASSMLVWLGVLTRLALSHAYPLLSISYVLVYVGATHWQRLAETATPARTAGTVLIALGVALVCASGSRPPPKLPEMAERPQTRPPRDSGSER